LITGPGTLTVIEILTKYANHPRGNGEFLPYDAYKFRSQGFLDYTGLGGFSSPIGNKLKSFMMYDQ